MKYLQAALVSQSRELTGMLGLLSQWRLLSKPLVTSLRVCPRVSFTIKLLVDYFDPACMECWLIVYSSLSMYGHSSARVILNRWIVGVLLKIWTYQLFVVWTLAGIITVMKFIENVFTFHFHAIDHLCSTISKIPCSSSSEVHWNLKCRISKWWP